jgi:UrcA family protein
MGELVTMSARLDVADLDLSTSSGADELRARINDVARDICHRLDSFYPRGSSEVPGHEDTNKNCVRDAVAAASKSAEAAISATHKQ